MSTTVNTLSFDAIIIGGGGEPQGKQKCCPCAPTAAANEAAATTTYTELFHLLLTRSVALTMLPSCTGRALPPLLCFNRQPGREFNTAEENKN
jgi:hypothetical protein